MKFTKKERQVAFTLLFASTMTVMAGAIISPSLVDIALYFKQVEPIYIKLIITLPAFFITIFGTFIGLLSDKWGRKKIFVFSLFLYAFSGVSGFFINNIYYLLLSRALLGIAVAGILTISTALIADNFTGKKRNTFAGLQGLFMALGGTFFGVLGGALANINWRLPFLIYATSLLLVLPVILFIRSSASTFQKKVYQKMTKKLLSTIIFVLSINFIGQVIFYMIPTQIPFLLQSEFQSSNLLIGIALATPNVTAMLSAFSHRTFIEKLSFQQIFIISFFLMSIGLACVYFAYHYSIMIFALSAFGLGFGFLLPNVSLWLMKLAPLKNRGFVLGMMTATMFLGQFLSPLFVRPLIRNFDLPTTFLIAAYFSLIASFLLFIFSLRKIN